MQDLARVSSPIRIPASFHSFKVLSRWSSYYAFQHSVLRARKCRYSVLERNIIS